MSTSGCLTLPVIARLATRARHDQAGFTLSEMLVVLVIMAIVIAALVSVLAMSITQNTQIQDKSTLQTEVRSVVENMAKEIRQAYSGDTTYPILTATTTSLEFLSPDRATPFHNRAHRLPARVRADRSGDDDEHRHRRRSLDRVRLDLVRGRPGRLLGQAGGLRHELGHLHVLRQERSPAERDDHAVFGLSRPDHRAGGDEGERDAQVHVFDERECEVEP